MMDAWDVLFLVGIVVLVLLCPKISPCVGCAAADHDNYAGDCRKDCRAFLDYVAKYGRR